MTRQVEGFALLERESIRRTVPSFEWLSFPDPSARNLLDKALPDLRIGLVSTAGARAVDQTAFDIVGDYGDPTYRVIPSDTSMERIRFDHAGYDVRFARIDPDCVFPLQLLRRYVDEGRIGGLGSSAYAVMGFITQTDVLMTQTAPAIAEGLRADKVDLALLVPA